MTAAGRNEDTRGLLRNGRPASGQCSPYFFPLLSVLIIASVFRTERLFSSALQKYKSPPPFKKSDIIYGDLFPTKLRLFQMFGCLLSQVVKDVYNGTAIHNRPSWSNGGRTGRNKPAQGQVKSQRQERFGAADSARGAFCVHVLVFPERGETKNLEKTSVKNRRAQRVTKASCKLRKRTSTLRYDNIEKSHKRWFRHLSVPHSCVPLTFPQNSVSRQQAKWRHGFSLLAKRLMCVAVTAVQCLLCS